MEWAFVRDGAFCIIYLTVSTNNNNTNKTATVPDETKMIPYPFIAEI